MVPPEISELQTSEEGMIEQLSTISWFAAAGLMAVYVWQSAWRPGMWAVLLLVCCALREMDYHRIFTGQSLLSSRFYFKGQVPWEQRLLGLAIIALLTYAVWCFFRAALPRWWQGLKRKEGPALAVAAVFGLGLLSKGIDRLHGTLSDFGLWHERSLPITFAIVEEVLELGMPLLTLVAILHFWWNSRSSSRAAN